MRLKTMTIDQALNNRSSELYAVNTFVDNSDKSADIVGEYRDVNAPLSQPRPYKIPASWIPQRISDIAPKESFLEGSSDFLSAVRRRWVVLVDPKQAAEFLSENEDAKIEADRVALILQGHSVGVSQIFDGEGELDLSRVRSRNLQTNAYLESLRINAPTDGNPNQAPDQQISPQVMNIMARTSDEMTDQTKLNALKSLATITAPERRYIQQNTHSPEIISWLSDVVVRDDLGVG